MNFKSIACGAFQDPLDKNDVGQILPLYYVWVNADGLIRTGETSHKTIYVMRYFLCSTLRSILRAKFGQCAF